MHFHGTNARAEASALSVSEPDLLRGDDMRGPGPPALSAETRQRTTVSKIMATKEVLSGGLLKRRLRPR